MSKRHILPIGIGAIVLLPLLILLIRLGYDWHWTGFGPYESTTTTTEYPSGKVTDTSVTNPGQTLWEWRGVLFGATAGASVAIYVNRFNTRGEMFAAQREEENRQETLLQTYLDRMSDLITDKCLLEEKQTEVRTVAQARTVAALPRLNTQRQGMHMDFLRRSGLGEILNNANLRRANLSGAELYEANLRGASLRGANLIEADLGGPSWARQTCAGSTCAGPTRPLAT